MSKILTYGVDNCFICSEFMGTFKNELTISTGYSEKQIYELIGKKTSKKQKNYLILIFPLQRNSRMSVLQVRFLMKREYVRTASLNSMIIVNTNRLLNKFKWKLQRSLKPTLALKISNSPGSKQKMKRMKKVF